MKHQSKDATKHWMGHAEIMAIRIVEMALARQNLERYVLEKKIRESRRLDEQQIP